MEAVCCGGETAAGEARADEGGRSRDGEAKLDQTLCSRLEPSGTDNDGMLTGGDVLAFFAHQKCCHPSMPVDVLGSGAYARVMLLKDGCGKTVCASEDTAVEACRMALKQGRWADRSAFEREVELQSAAAAAGLAPRIFFSTWLGGSGKDAIGLISMQRLSQPTFFKWLIWQTEAHRDTLRSAAARARSQEYLVDPKVAKSPLYKTWAAEARRLRAGLRTLGIAHGDVHENNLVFHVEAETCPTDEEMASDDGRTARKKRLLDAIALGPSGPARLLMIDFGRAKSVKGRLAWLMEDVFGGGRRMVDPTQVPST